MNPTALHITACTQATSQDIAGTVSVLDPHLGVLLQQILILKLLPAPAASSTSPSTTTATTSAASTPTPAASGCAASWLGRVAVLTHFDLPWVDAGQALHIREVHTAAVLAHRKQRLGCGVILGEAADLEAPKATGNLQQRLIFFQL